MMRTTIRTKISRILLPIIALIIVLATGAGAMAAAGKTVQKTFADPDMAAKSLAAAVKNSDTKELLAILGPGAQAIVSSGDPVEDQAGRERFIKLYEEKFVIEGADSGKAVLVLGNEEFPFPIPVVKKGATWTFDTKAGKEELLNRRIGRNELQVIEVLRAYVDAQREYAAKDRDGDGTAAFAQRIRSTPGKHDGLYWETKEGEEESPLGPFAAKAAGEGYTQSKGSKPTPYHGYLFKVLKAQGKNAEGGAYSYVVNGKMILGFAMVAYPARYGASGVMTFVVNQNGVVYQKDLGRNTAKAAAAMKLYNPDKSWTKIE
jgi:Protein of unknown function (DUF2950)